MVNITNVGQTTTTTPTENNQRVNPDNAKTTESSERVDPTTQPRFVDRRRNRDRRTHTKTPLLDTRKNRDRRRTSRIHVEV